MASINIEVHPKNSDFDPLARQIQSELLEAGHDSKNAVVFTCRLYRIDGNFSTTEIERVAQTLLVDPVVETVRLEENTKLPARKTTKNGSKGTNGWVVDVWPKPR